MAIDIERLLRLTADFHNFSNDMEADENAVPDNNELSLDELDFIAAAANMLRQDPEKK